MAENLHMTVARLSEELTYREFEGWMRFYEQKAAQEKGETQGPAGSDEDWTPEKVARAFNIG